MFISPAEKLSYSIGNLSIIWLSIIELQQLNHQFLPKMITYKMK